MEEIVQGYTVERELVKRGLRRTVLAREAASDKSVVVKVVTLPPGEAAANADRARFRHLVEKIQKLSGEEFVPILSWGEENGKLYLVREHEEGMTLGEVLGVVSRFPVELAGLLFKEIARAIQKAHAQQIAHLDLTQANIVFRQDGRLVFTDWVKEEEGMPASPAAEGAQWFWQKADQNLDLFSMGVLFAKVLVGEPKVSPEASEAETVVTLSQALNADPSISERVAKIIHKLLGEEFDRYGGAEEVLADLDAYISQLGEFDPQVAWQRFLEAPAAFVAQLNEWKAKQIAREAKELLEEGKVNEAKAEFERALAINPDCTEAEAELELLAAKEGLVVEKLQQPKAVSKPPVSDLFEKLRSSEPLTLAKAPGEKKAPAVEENRVTIPTVPEETEEETTVTDDAAVSETLFVSRGALKETTLSASPPTEEILVEPERPVVLEELEKMAPPSSEMAASTQPALKSAVSHVEVPTLTPMPAAPVVETEVLEPTVEKPGEEGKAGIGFEEAVASLPEEKGKGSPREGRGALEVPETMGAEEYVALARGGRKLPWKIFALVGGVIAIVLVAVFFLKGVLNRPKEVQKDAEALYQEALRAQEVGDIERALGKFDQVARQYGNTPQARLALSSSADLEWRLGRQEKALGHYQQVVTGNPGDSLGREARFHRALIFREQKKDNDALNELSFSLSDSSGDKRILEAKMVAAKLLHTLGMADSALGVYSRALAEDQNNLYAVEMHKERGLIFEEKEDWRSARSEYDAILGMTQSSDLSHVWAEQKASAVSVKMGGGRGR